MTASPLALLVATPPLCAAVGALVGLAAGVTGHLVAARSHAAGLRAQAPRGWLGWAGPGLASAGLSWVAVLPGAEPVLREVVVGLIWGYWCGDLANNLRAAAALQAVEAAEGGVAAWQAVPRSVRAGLVSGNLASVGGLVVAAALLSGQPGLLGFALGAAGECAALGWRARGEARR